MSGVSQRFSEGFEGRVALITGGSRGIGRALAFSLAELGAIPVVNYRRNEDAAAEALRGLRERGASEAVAIRADLEDVAEIEGMFDQVRERFGRLDFFVSNAAASNFRPFMELKSHNLERTFNLNVRAFVVGAQRAVGLMPGAGRIVVLSSYGASTAYPTYANLGSAKAALEAWTRYMAVELAPRGINVNAVNGGIIESDSSAYFYATGRVAPLETVLPEDPQAPHGHRPGGGRRRALLALPRLGVRDRHRFDGRRRADRDRAAVRGGPRRLRGSAGDRRERRRGFKCRADSPLRVSARRTRRTGVTRRATPRASRPRRARSPSPRRGGRGDGAPARRGWSPHPRERR